MIIDYSSDDGETFVQSPAGSLYFPNQSSFNVRMDRYSNFYIYRGDELLISQDKGRTWQDISPSNPTPFLITDLEVGPNSHIYLTICGTPILKSNFTVDQKLSLIHI